MYASISFSSAFAFAFVFRDHSRFHFRLINLISTTFCIQMPYCRVSEWTKSNVFIGFHIICMNALALRSVSSRTTVHIRTSTSAIPQLALNTNAKACGARFMATFYDTFDVHSKKILHLLACHNV